MAAKKTAAKKTTDAPEPAVDEADLPVGDSFHDELQNLDADHHQKQANTTAPVHEGVPQGPGFSAKDAKTDE